MTRLMPLSCRCTLTFGLFGKDARKDDPVDGMIWVIWVISRNTKAMVSHEWANEHFKPARENENLIKNRMTLARNLVKTTFARKEL